MGNEEKRSATDILLNLEDRFGTLEKRIQNSENLLKLLLGRLNAGAQTAQTPSTPPPGPPGYKPVRTPIEQIERPNPRVVNKENFDTRPKTSKFIEAAAKQGIKIEEPKPDPERLVARPPGNEEIDPDEMVEASTRGNARGQRGPKSSGAKSSISQVLMREDQPLFLANVEVLDQEGVLINKTRTNTKGRWLMALAPGDYQVHVLKRFPPDSGRLPIDTTYPISVPPSDKPMELDSLSLGGQ